MQLFYPWDKTLPGARVGSLQLGSISYEQAEAKLSETYKDWTRVVKTSNHEYSVGMTDVGIKIDSKATANDPLSYPFWQRLIPGSFVYRFFNSNVRPKLFIEADILKAFADKVQSESHLANTNATVVVEGDVASIKAEVDGVDYPSYVTTIVLAHEFFNGQGELKLKHKVIKPKISQGAAKPALRDAQKLIGAPPKYVVGDKQAEVPKAAVGAWLLFNANEESGRIEVSLSEQAIKDYLSSLYPYEYTVSGQTGRVPGDSSKAINVDSAIKDFQTVLKHKGEVQTVQIAHVDVNEDMRSGRGYSRSQLGLQTLVRDLASEKGEYAIALQELSGRGWAASANGAEEYTPGSTYKLFVAYSVLKNIETGIWSWGGSIAGASVEECFDVMIIKSDNACAVAFGKEIGWKNIENQMQGLGLKNTTLEPGYFISTANDELLFMTKLGRGEILTQASRDKLVDVMKRQIYRDGIPAGANAPVANKVGFLWNLLNDAALVYAPKGTYALVILTNNSSWGEIAEVTSKIQKHLE